jgi:hypothetical protein
MNTKREGVEIEREEEELLVAWHWNVPGKLWQVAFG